MSLTIPTTSRQEAALAAAAAADNVANRRDPPLTPEQFATMRFGAEMDGWAQTLEVGLITVYEFVERFQKEGVYEAIVARSETDPHVAGYLGELRKKGTKPGEDPRVNLFSPTVAAGLGYLVTIELITTEQAQRIGATTA